MKCISSVADFASGRDSSVAYMRKDNDTVFTQVHICLQCMYSNVDSPLKGTERILGVLRPISAVRYGLWYAVTFAIGVDDSREGCFWNADQMGGRDMFDCTAWPYGDTRRMPYVRSGKADFGGSVGISAMLSINSCENIGGAPAQTIRAAPNGQWSETRTDALQPTRDPVHDR